MKDFYQILGVDGSCPAIEIKDAYRKLSKKYHPDLNQDDEYFEKRFREITEAYYILSDPEKRNTYDNDLSRFKAPVSEHNYRRKQPYTAPSQNGFGFKATPPPYQKLRRRGPGAGVTIVLILIGIIFSAYLFKSFTSAKANKIKHLTAVKAYSFQSHKKHRKKHLLLNKTPVNLITHVDSIKAVPLKPMPVKPMPVKPVVDTPVTSRQEKAFLYATYVKPNVTGIVNMREADSFGSGIVTVIPANAKVLVLQKADIYYKVAYNNTIGYVPKWSLATKQKVYYQKLSILFLVLKTSFKQFKKQKHEKDFNGFNCCYLKLRSNGAK